MGEKMGLQFGLYMGPPWATSPGGGNSATKFGVFKRRFRWLFCIDDICATEGVNALPPSQAARPTLSFKEQEARHVTENFYYPMKPDWRPLQLVLYDLYKGVNLHPVWEWLLKLYDPKNDAKWYAPTQEKFIREARLKLMCSNGDVMETWVFENVWPQVTDFGRLEMTSSDIVTCDLTLRYARAYIDKDSSSSTGTSTNTNTNTNTNTSTTGDIDWGGPSLGATFH